MKGKRKQKQIEFLLWSQAIDKAKGATSVSALCDIWLILPVLYADVKD